MKMQWGTFKTDGRGVKNVVAYMVDRYNFLPDLFLTRRELNSPPVTIPKRLYQVNTRVGLQIFFTNCKCYCLWEKI